MVCVLGLYLYWQGKAASSVVSVQPELGNVTSPAIKTSDSGASAGQAVRFNAPAPQPSPPPPTSGVKLTWAPPAGYTSYPVKNISNTSSFNQVNCGGGDAFIKLPRDKLVGPVYIIDCRNAVMIGGSIRVLPTSVVDGQDQRAIYVKNGTGTIHIEGVYIEGNVSGSTADAIAINAPSAIVVMQNINANAMRGSSANHADVVQPWGGVREYRIDRMTGSTNYQGLHVGEAAGKVIGRGTIRNANIFSSGVQSDGKAGQYIWLPDSGEYPVALEGVYISGRPGDPFSRSIWPSTNSSSCAAKISGSPAVATWPGCAWITGKVTQGKPPGGDYVPPSSVGLNYVSPGYL